VVLPNGKKLKYTLSGHLQFWLTIILMGHAIPNIIETAPDSQVYVIKSFSPLKLSVLYDNYVQLISISTVGAFVLSFYLYISSYRGKDKIMAKGGDTGNAIYDFFIGNPIILLFLLCVCLLFLLCLRLLFLLCASLSCHYVFTTLSLRMLASDLLFFHRYARCQYWRNAPCKHCRYCYRYPNAI
jgi:Ergosterol biosynthesis ERG4/ERG24 family